MTLITNNYFINSDQVINNTQSEHTSLPRDRNKTCTDYITLQEQRKNIENRQHKVCNQLSAVRYASSRAWPGRAYLIPKRQKVNETCPLIPCGI